MNEKKEDSGIHHLPTVLRLEGKEAMTEEEQQADTLPPLPSLPPPEKVEAEHEKIREHFRKAIEELKPDNDGDDAA